MLFGPKRLNTTGRNSNPWNSPKTTTRKKTLKNVRKTIDFDMDRRTNAKKVEIPPFRTAGAVLIIVCFNLSFLEPLATMKAWAMWAE